MECRHCGKKTRDGRYFCGGGCYEGWKKENKTRPGKRNLIPSEGLPPGEKARRAELFAEARAGDAVAAATLKNHYGVTAIWDGKRLRSL